MTATSTPPVRTSPGPRIPLRITLIALLVGLVTLALLATGFATSALLKGYLQSEQDAQLLTAAEDARHDIRQLEACIAREYRQASRSEYYACIAPGSGAVNVLLGPLVVERDSPAKF